MVQRRVFGGRKYIIRATGARIYNTTTLYACPSTEVRNRNWQAANNLHVLYRSGRVGWIRSSHGVGLYKIYTYYTHRYIAARTIIIIIIMLFAAGFSLGTRFDRQWPSGRGTQRHHFCIFCRNRCKYIIILLQ